MSYLHDCASKDPAVNELFIVQPDFAAAAKEMRDRMTQAVLSIDGSIVKIKGARLDVVLDCEEVKSIIASLGVGLEYKGWQDTYHLSRLRYGKVILAMDGTAEGRYICEQIVSFFYRFSGPMLRAGHVFLAPANEKELAATFMSPTSRVLIPLRAGRILAQTLELAALGARVP